jgi:undecaprenyl-diphosphatase
MDYYLILKVIIIGIVEGITEFLPISSTGHMIIVGDFINFKAPDISDNYRNMFDVVIQLGAILAIVVLYWKKFKDSLVHLSGYGFKLWRNILLAFLPSAALGFALHDKIEEYLFSTTTVAVALVIGALLMLYMERSYRKGNKINNIDDVNAVQSLKIGLFQCLSLWPGMSRSASTIMGGWVSGLSNIAAAEFSFFLAIPTMIAASGYVTLKAILRGSVAFTSSELAGLVVGFIVSFLVAMLVVDGFIAFLKKKSMRVFAIYRLIIGVILLILIYLGIIG